LTRPAQAGVEPLQSEVGQIQVDHTHRGGKPSLRRHLDQDAANRVDKLAAMAQSKYTHRHCTVCRADKDFKVLAEQDMKGRTLMVCTSCGSKIPVPGQKNPTWAELLVDDA